MKMIEIRKALGMTQTEFAKYFDRTQTWCTRIDHVDSDDLPTALSAAQWATLRAFKEKAERIEVVKTENGL